MVALREMKASRGSRHQNGSKWINAGGGNKYTMPVAIVNAHRKWEFLHVCKHELMLSCVVALLLPRLKRRNRKVPEY